MTPTARTLAWAKELGWIPAVVERWNQFSRTRHDLFGFIDILVMRPGMKLLGIQATSTDNISHRIAKIQESPHAALWLERQSLMVIGWSKRGPRGKRKTWQPSFRILAVDGGRVVDCGGTEEITDAI